MSGLPPGRLRPAEHVMGTVVSFDVPARVVRSPFNAEAGGALGDAVRWLHWVDATFSPYLQDSDVSLAEGGAHIVNPHTGQPAVGLASVTVAGASLAATDAYATAAFAMGPGARDWAESLDGYEAFAITADGAAWQTSGFRSYLG